MPRYIDADALIEELEAYEEELKNDREIAIETGDEQVLFAIMNQETAICRIRRNVLHMPTAFDVEKVVSELDDSLNKIEKYLNDYSQGQVLAYLRAINIVKAGGVE